MTQSDFVYTTYIKSTPEKVWNAITTPEFARQYWGGHENISDWKKGSEWKHVADAGRDIKMVGKIVEINPPKRLVMTWARPDNRADDSQVAIDIAMAGDMVRVDVVHSKLSDDMSRSISMGWPLVLSSLKSFIETGKGMDIWAGHRGSCAPAQKGAA